MKHLVLAVARALVVLFAQRQLAEFILRLQEQIDVVEDPADEFAVPQAPGVVGKVDFFGTAFWRTLGARLLVFVAPGVEAPEPGQKIVRLTAHHIQPVAEVLAQLLLRQLHVVVEEVAQQIAGEVRFEHLPRVLVELFRSHPRDRAEIRLEILQSELPIFRLVQHLFQHPVVRREVCGNRLVNVGLAAEVQELFELVFAHRAPQRTDLYVAVMFIRQVLEADRIAGDGIVTIHANLKLVVAIRSEAIALATEFLRHVQPLEAQRGDQIEVFAIPGGETQETLAEAPLQIVLEMLVFLAFGGLRRQRGKLGTLRCQRIGFTLRNRLFRIVVRRRRDLVQIGDDVRKAHVVLRLRVQHRPTAAAAEIGEHCDQRLGLRGVAGLFGGVALLQLGALFAPLRAVDRQPHIHEKLAELVRLVLVQRHAGQKDDPLAGELVGFGGVVLGIARLKLGVLVEQLQLVEFVHPDVFAHRVVVGGGFEDPLHQHVEFAIRQQLVAGPLVGVGEEIAQRIDPRHQHDGQLAEVLEVALRFVDVEEPEKVRQLEERRVVGLFEILFNLVFPIERLRQTGGSGQPLQVVDRIVEVEQKVFLFLLDLGPILRRIAQFAQRLRPVGRQELRCSFDASVTAVITTIVRFVPVHDAFSSSLCLRQRKLNGSTSFASSSGGRRSRGCSRRTCSRSPRSGSSCAQRSTSFP